MHCSGNCNSRILFNELYFMRKLILIISIAVLSISCAKEESCPSGSPNITGAVCNDGTKSSATGSGACSHHDGVDYWVCSN